MQLIACLKVGDLISPAANLLAGATVRGGSVGMETEIAFAGDCHAESSVGEHLDFDKTPGRTADVLTDYGFVYLLDLVEIKFAGKDNHVGELSIEPQRLHIGDAELRGDVHLDSNPAAIGYGGHV